MDTAEHERRWLRAADLCSRWGISRVTLWEWWAKRKILPPPAQLGPNTKAWPIEAVLEHERNAKRYRVEAA